MLQIKAGDWVLLSNGAIAEAKAVPKIRSSTGLQILGISYRPDGQTSLSGFEPKRLHVTTIITKPVYEVIPEKTKAELAADEFFEGFTKLSANGNVRQEFIEVFNKYAGVSEISTVEGRAKCVACASEFDPCGGCGCCQDCCDCE